MQTPEHFRRNTRAALVELPTVMDITFTDDQREGRNFYNFQNNVLNDVNFLPTNLLTPQSPDEIVIRQRGRRKIPTVFSPDIDELKRNRSQKKDDSPNTIVLRSTPKKRSLLLGGNDNKRSPGKMSPKKLRLEAEKSSFEEVISPLKACTSNQLISVINKLLEKRPDVEKDLKDITPQPDLKPIQNHLHYLRKNVSKSLPTNRLCSKTDSVAYQRVAAHIANFKKTVFDHGLRFAESKQWATVMEYNITAWNVVKMLPSFDNATHNATRRQCFKFIATQCLTAIKNNTFSREELTSYLTKFKEFIVDCEEIKPVVLFLELELNNEVM